MSKQFTPKNMFRITKFITLRLSLVVGIAHRGHTKTHQKNMYSPFWPLLSFRCFVPQIDWMLFPQPYYYNLCCSFHLIVVFSIDCLFRFLPRDFLFLSLNEHPHTLQVLLLLHFISCPQCLLSLPFSSSLSCFLCSWELKWHNISGKPRSTFGHWHRLSVSAFCRPHLRFVQ